MSKLAELLRLWQARDDARKALHEAPPGKTYGLAGKAAIAETALINFINKHRAAEVGAVTEIALQIDDDEVGLGAPADAISLLLKSGKIALREPVKAYRFISLKPGWFAAVEGGAYLTAPTREELERLIKEAGDA